MFYANKIEELKDFPSRRHRVQFCLALDKLLSKNIKNSEEYDYRK